MLVAVDDHAELRAPVAEVVVADRPMAKEAERAAEGVADHGRADMADVHRLGHVGSGVIDHVGPRRRCRLDAQARIVDRGRKLLDEPRIPQPQIDEARPGDFRRVAEVGHVEPGDDLGGQLLRLLVQLPAQRHGEVGLVIAESRVLGAADHLQPRLGLIGERSQRLAKSGLKIGKQSHGENRKRQLFGQKNGEQKNKKGKGKTNLHELTLIYLLVKISSNSCSLPVLGSYLSALHVSVRSLGLRVASSSSGTRLAWPQSSSSA